MRSAIVALPRELKLELLPPRQESSFCVLPQDPGVAIALRKMLALIWCVAISCLSRPVRVAKRERLLLLLHQNQRALSLAQRAISPRAQSVEALKFCFANARTHNLRRQFLLRVPVRRLQLLLTLRSRVCVCFVPLVKCNRKDTPHPTDWFICSLPRLLTRQIRLHQIQENHSNARATRSFAQDAEKILTAKERLEVHKTTTQISDPRARPPLLTLQLYFVQRLHTANPNSKCLSAARLHS